MWRIKQFFRNIIRIIKWVPRLWNNEDWDHNYALYVFRFKLSDIADYIEKNGHLENGKNKVSRIRTAIRFIDKVYGDDDYLSEYHKEFDALYGERIMVNNPVPGKPDLTTIEFKFIKDYTDEELEDIKKHRELLFNEAIKKQKRAHKLLWDFIEHNIEDWWD